MFTKIIYKNPIKLDGLFWPFCFPWSVGRRINH